MESIKQIYYIVTALYWVRHHLMYIYISKNNSLLGGYITGGGMDGVVICTGVVVITEIKTSKMISHNN